VLVATRCNAATLLLLPPPRERERVTVYRIAVRAYLCADAAAARWERNSVLSDKQLPPSGLIAVN